jgi:Zn-dependent protease
MVLVAAAGPAMNIGLAIAAALSFHLVVYLPVVVAQWTALNLKNALIINVVLAFFNLFPLPPLDGGRIAVGLLPNVLAKQLARLEPYGIHCTAAVGFAIRSGSWLCVASYRKLVLRRCQGHPPIDWKRVVTRSEDNSVPDSESQVKRQGDRTEPAEF